MIWTAAGADVEKNIMVPVTSDKGLCGGINTTVSKYTRGTLATVKEGTLPPGLPVSSSRAPGAPGARQQPGMTLAFQVQPRCADASKEAKIIVMGEKGRAQLGRYEKDSILSSIADTNKVAITFSQV